MKQPISKIFKQLSGVIVSFVCVGFVHGGPGLAAGYIDFANRSSNIALTSNSILRIKNPSKVVGWGQGSITRLMGDEAATAWVPAYVGDTYLTGTNTTPSLVVNNSNAIINSLQYITNNSNAIVKNTQDITNNSNTLLYLERTDSNAKIYLAKNNSNAIINALWYVANNSNAIVKNTQDIKNNSNAIVLGFEFIENNWQEIVNNSNALLFCCKNTSNTLLYLNNNNSNAIVKNTGDIKNNSNAIILSFDFIENNSNAIVKNTQDIKNNSNSIVKNTEDIRVNSNALLFCCKNTSNTLNFLTKNNSNAIIKNTVDIRVNSNAMLFGDKNNSNTLLYLNRTSSNAFAFGIKNNSNSIVKNTADIRVNSNALLFCCKNTSNTLIYLTKNNSNAIIKITVDIRTLSNAMLFGDKNNSNTLLYLNRTMSNAFAFCCKNTSNTLLYLTRINSNAMIYLTKNNSNAIVWLDTQMHTIDHGPLDHEVVTTTTHMIFDIYLSHEHHMNVHTSTVIDGHGHVINFAKDQPDVFNVDAGCNVTLTNVILRGYEDEAVSLDTGASVVFGDGTRIELQETPVQLERDWTFEGDARVEGLATRLMIEPYNIVVSPNSTLLLGDIDLVALKQNNMRCGGDTSSITLRNIAMHMTHDYSFTSGALQFEQDIVMTGTGKFTLGTNMPSTILENSSLIVDGPTFSYAPSIVDRDLLVMTDETSRLILLGSILDSSTAGLRLTKGTLKVDHINYITNAGALLPSEGISLGDGVAADDLYIEMLPGGSLEVMDGILTYENVN